MSIAVTAILGPYFANIGLIYGPEDGTSDATWAFVMLLLWDRYFGPYSKTLRKVCKYLPGRETVTESYEYDR